MAGLVSLGCSAVLVSSFERYRDDLLRFNRGQNLTSRRGSLMGLEELLLESAAVASLLPPLGPFLDIGTGAGLPGMSKTVFPILFQEKEGREYTICERFTEIEFIASERTVSSPKHR